jgi:C1A family cysteine protease
MSRREHSVRDGRSGAIAVLAASCRRILLAAVVIALIVTNRAAEAGEHFLGHRPRPSPPVRSTADAPESAEASPSLPTSYDLRNVSGVNYVTSVKDQGNRGSCWTFATYGAMESDLLRAGGPSSDFSENNLKNCHGFDWDDGGNDSMSIAYLSRLAGPGAEADDPYHDWDDRATAPVTIPRQRFLRNASAYDTAAEMKTAIMTKGGLYVDMLWRDSSYRASDYTYYYNGGSYEGGHAVTAVGWNDNKDTPSRKNGAWLCKNSWGTSWGDQGYFWISYQDAAACSYGRSFETDPADTVSDVYYHDQFGEVTMLDAPYACNVFQTGSKAETLKSVGFFTEKDTVNYVIRVYDEWSSDHPSELLASKSGTIDKWGFHVVDLDQLVSLAANDDFAVYVYLDGGYFDAGTTYYQAVDYAYPDYTSTSTASPGESLYSVDGSSWTDLTTLDPTANFCIKAYMIDVAEPIPGDATGDGRVDNQDAAVLAAHWGLQISGGTSVGDFNGDGWVNAADASILAGNWGHGSGTGESSNVPEPDLLCGLALAMVVAARPRRSV